MSYYCHLDSNNDPEATNLQLYSLQRAADEWNSLVTEVLGVGVTACNNLRERFVFTVNCLGLSLAQLLGQNFPVPSSAQMGDPSQLLNKLINQAGVERDLKRRLGHAFSKFLKLYGAIRHFGLNKDHRNYRLIDELTLADLDRYRKMTIEIWDLAISQFRNDKESDIDPFESIAELVRFEKLP